MDYRTSLRYMIIVYFVLIFLSRLIRPIVGNYYVEPVTCELITFAVISIIDFLAMYAMMRFGHDRGIFETINLVFLKAFIFVLFYILGVIMIYYTIDQVTKLVNFILFY